MPADRNQIPAPALLSDHALRNLQQLQMLRTEREGKFEALNSEPQGDGFAEEVDGE